MALVALGAVARPHGVRGEVRVHRFHEGSTLLLEQHSVWLRREGDERSVKVEGARVHGRAVLLKLEGVDDRDAADGLRGAEVCVDRADFPPPDEGEVYLADLVGLRALCANGDPAGEVVGVLSYPSAECLVLRSEGGQREVPLLEPYVVRVDLAAGTVVVDHLEDLE